MAKVLVQPTQKFPRMCAEVNDSSSRGSYDVVTDKVVRRSMRLLLQQEGFGHERLFDSIDPNEDRRGETGELVQAVAERIKFLLKDQPNSLSSINDLTENQWIIHTGNVHSEYIRVAHLLFSDNVNWGRVVTLIGFSANYCLYAVQQGIMESIVESVCGWAVSFMERELNDWFSRNSWVSGGLY